VDSDSTVDILFAGARAGSTDAESLTAIESTKDGLRLQQAVLGRWIETGDSLGGYKIAFTSGAGRDLMGPGYRPFGYVLSSRIFHSGDQIERSRIGTCVLEAEVCLVVGKPLRGQIDIDTARDAVAGMAPALEINEVRLPQGVDHKVLLADNLGGWGIVVGDLVPLGESLADTKVELSKDGAGFGTVVPGESMDDPLLALTRVCAALDELGLGLEPGQHVITGAFTLQMVEEPSQWRAEFAGLGDVEVTFTP
jgi:2-keto-4-pentenoate hydratase